LAREPWVSFDADTFLRRIDWLTADCDTRIDRGLGKVGLQWLHDALMIAPTVPLDEGTLRGSGSAHVGGKLVHTTPRWDGHGTPNEDPIPAEGGKKFVVVGFNTPYAAKVHELDMYFQEPSAGNGYLGPKGIARASFYRDAILGPEIRGMTT
jgi:hypothetical protein